MGKLLANSEQVPDLVICSSAIRAKQTLELSVQSGKWICKIREDKKLYFDGISSIVNIIQNLPNNYSRVMLVGHEPKWSTLINEFIGGGEVRVPTAAMARIDFDVDNWSDLNFGSGTLRWLLQPSFFTKGYFEF